MNAGTFFSTVGVLSLFGQGPGCFCPEIIVGADEFWAFYIFEQLVDGLLGLGWVRSSEDEAAKKECHSIVHQQVEQSGSMRVPAIDVFSISCGQPGFCSLCYRFQVSNWFGIM